MAVILDTNDHSSRSRARRRRFVLGAAAVFLMFLCGLFVVRGLGRWLVREDPLTRGDVIVVLSGSMPARAKEAAEIFHEHFAPEVWLTHRAGPREELDRLGIHYYGEDDYNLAVLVREGVPREAIKILPDPIVDTEEEIREVARELRARSKTKAIIVTSAPHTRRVRTLWQKLAGKGVAAIVRAAPQDPFDGDHWWRDTASALSVAREVLGLMNAWAGLPVRPRVQ
jgi:uncharacterized SAM-binding protein YcdF (DUF218 family)